MSNCYVNVVGGLGNQLFQIAAGYAYAKKYDKKLIINPANWNAGQGNNPNTYKDSIFSNFEYGSYFTRDVIGIGEKRFNYDELPYYDGHVSLNGYFQSLKYFEEVKDEFISLLNLPKVDVDFLRQGKSEVVGIHIRRGDYLKYKNIHFVCDTNYFNHFFEIFKDYPIKVFTDSIDDVMIEFPCSYKNRLPSYEIIHSQSDVKELTYMSQCDIIVGSNSTFSWWASLIGGKTSYFPSKWFADGREHEDIFREDMILKNV